jgi:hypothetical protein
MRTPVVFLTLLLTVAAFGSSISNPSYAAQSVNVLTGMLSGSGQAAPPTIILTGGHGSGHVGGRGHGSGGGWRHSGGSWHGGRRWHGGGGVGLNPYYGGNYYSYPNQGCVWDGYEWVCPGDEF